MTFLDRIQLARADEQMARIPPQERAHDGWAIRGGDGPGRLDVGRYRFRRPVCLACEKPTWRGTSYCQTHGDRVAKGYPVDLDLMTITVRELRRMSCGRKFGTGSAYLPVKVLAAGKSKGGG